MTPEQIIQIAQAGGLILLVVSLLTGEVWAKPAVEFLKKVLEDAIKQISELAAALKDISGALRENTNALRELAQANRDVLAEIRRRPLR